ncbi:MFS transporter [Bacillus sp. RG28]|uniref:MFS transporter n=1 Tax=Gottfriedia endophytica TaxID=2820819 RepID=A0A940NR82_9BACI|nr:MFS transporter [Gottfriedia endophytica]MBP0725497.1 MFS transporter [Gottfriedia endophytica]
MSSKAYGLDKGYTDSHERQKVLYKRTLLIVCLSQIFGGAGLAAGVTVGALLAQQMLGTEAFSGLPAALLTLGSAGAAFIVGRLSQRFGRRLGLTAGFMTGGIGAIGVMIAAATNSVILLFASLLIYGAGTATNLQVRYAGTDLANESQRATAISIAMVSTTFGAVAGPNLVGVMGSFALSIGVPALAGPFILSAAAFILAGLVLFIMLRPDPLIIAKMIEANKQGLDHKENLTTIDRINNKRGIVVGATVMVLTQIVMVAIMTMTPVHMKHHGHSLGEVGLVIGFHIGSMYLPSLITGILVDKIGRTAMSIASGATLLLAGILAAVAPSDSMTFLVIALSLLGLGWNFGLISGTAQIVDSTDPSTRAKTQGTVDVFVALAGASGGALSGMVVANSSYATLGFSGAIMSLLLIPVVIWSRSGNKNSKHELDM